MNLEYLSVPSADLRRVRADGYDDFGNRVVAREAEGGEPLRCCLTIAEPGEKISLMAYRPSSLGGPYAEVGPVFVHADACDGYRGEGFPEQYRNRRAVIRPYDVDGLMLDGVLAEPGTSEDHIHRFFENPRVAFVHVRNVVAGCWNFSVRRSV